MSEMSRTARRAMRAKIHRLTKGVSGKVDASDYGPEENLHSEVKTGARPISRRAFKKGGKVVANEGKDAAKHAGKRPRNGGKAITANTYINRDVKEANEERDGFKHVGAFKRGGKVKKAAGGEMVYRERRSVPKTISDMYDREDRAREAHLMTPQGDAERRARNEAMIKGMKARKDGGKVKKASGGIMAPGLYGMQNEGATSRMSKAAGLKKGGRARKADGGDVDDMGGMDDGDEGMDLGAGKGSSRQVPLITAPKGPIKTRPKPSQQPKPREFDDPDGERIPTAAEVRARMGFKKGGKMPVKKWEGSHKDLVEDKKLAKKHHMTFKDWEKSGLDKKHDKQQSMKGLKRGGSTSVSDGELEGTRPTGGRMARATGGRAKGKTNINIVIGTGQRPTQQPMGGMPPAPGGATPVPVPPPAPGGAPMPMAGAPAPMPAPAGLGAAGPMPMARKSGGRTYRSYKDMDAGAGSGEGRLEKSEIQTHKR